MSKLFTTAALIACLALPATAGGPVLVSPEETEVTDARDARDNRAGWIIPVVIGVLIIAALSSGGDDAPAEPPKGCLNDGGGC